MLKLLAPLLVPTLLTLSASAQIERRDVYLSKSSFDGKVFEYTYTAYGAARIDKFETHVTCTYGTFESDLVLKSLDIKMTMEANFGSEISLEQSGHLNISNEIEKCYKNVPEAALHRQLNAPVQINLPPISAPSLTSNR